MELHYPVCLCLGLFQENPNDPPVSFLRASPGNGSETNFNVDENDRGFDWPR